MQHWGTRYILHTYECKPHHITENKGRYDQQPSQCIEKKDTVMQLQTSRVPAQKYVSSNVPNVLRPHLYIGAFLLAWPPLLTPTNELRIAVQAIGDEIHDVFLGSLIHKRLHSVASLEQTCIPISNVLQLRAPKDQVSLIPQTVLTPGADGCADRVARVGSCVGLKCRLPN